MTIKQALKWLDSLAKQHGENTEIFFDCPKCGIAYKPTTIVAEAVHLKSEEKTQ